MATTYQFNISSPLTYVKAILISLLVPVVYLAIIYLFFPSDTLIKKADYFFFVGGALWFIAFVTAIYKSGEKMICEIGNEGLKLQHPLSSGKSSGRANDLDWDRLESYSITQDINGILLLMKLKDSGIKKWITIPLINNDRKQVEQFLFDFQKYALQYNASQTASEKKIKRGKSFYQSRAARIIGYFFIAYLLIITILKISGLDGGRLPWSNILSTCFFAAVYLVFVFWLGKRNSE